MALTKKDEIRIIFCKNLKYYRITNKLTQAELAEKIDLSDKYVSDLERNKIPDDEINDALEGQDHFKINDENFIKVSAKTGKTR